MYYRIITTAPGSTIETNVLEPDGQGAWTHESATRWAHVDGNRLPAGTVVRIWKRPSRGGYLVQHRRYLVGADGIVRRTDRRCDVTP